MNAGALSDRRATCAASCYEVEPGHWIHHPWAGCGTVSSESGKLERRVLVTCWHCKGEMRCGCMACWQGGPGECVACQGTGQVLRWIQ